LKVKNMRMMDNKRIPATNKLGSRKGNFVKKSLDIPRE